MTKSVLFFNASVRQTFGIGQNYFLPKPFIASTNKTKTSPKCELYIISIHYSLIMFCLKALDYYQSAEHLQIVNKQSITQYSTRTTVQYSTVQYKYNSARPRIDFRSIITRMSKWIAINLSPISVNVRVKILKSFMNNLQHTFVALLKPNPRAIMRTTIRVLKPDPCPLNFGSGIRIRIRRPQCK